MKVGIIGHSVSEKDHPFLTQLFGLLYELNVPYALYSKLAGNLQEKFGASGFSVFDSHESFMLLDVDYILSLGGDGTILKAITYVRDSGIPIMGINLGRAWLFGQH